MNLLVLGGTQFVGKHIVLAALARGHSVTTLTRGQTPDDLPAAVTRLRGDRSDTEHGLDALQGGTWDACIDVSGYLPRVVRRSAEQLKDQVGRYLFISTVSVYAPGERETTTEDAPLLELEDPATEDISAHYGGLKVLCERVVGEVYADRATHVRPHVVAGPDDHTKRFTSWPEALAGGGDVPDHQVLAPGDGTDPVQYIDARDLADFTVHLLEQNTPGTFHTAAPSLPWRTFLTRMQAAINPAARLMWTPVAALEARGLSWWSDVPLFLPRAEDDAATLRVDSSRAVAAGLKCRPLEDTASDTLAWSVTQPREKRPVIHPAR